MTGNLSSNKQDTNVENGKKETDEEKFTIVIDGEFVERVGGFFPKIDEDAHEIEIAIDTFLQRVEDIRFCVRTIIPYTAKFRSNLVGHLLKNLIKGGNLLNDPSFA